MSRFWLSDFFDDVWRRRVEDLMSQSDADRREQIDKLCVALSSLLRTDR